MKLPKPPLPPGLRPKPPRPGEDGHNGRNGSKNGAPTEAEQRHPAAEAGVSALGWADERSNLSPFLRAFLYRKVPKGISWYQTLGSATMFAFVSQAATGVFLAMYYDPNVSNAYTSAQRITNEVFLGELVRGMHRWGSTVMIVLIFMHMGRTFFFGAYKYPRELN